MAHSFFINQQTPDLLSHIHRLGFEQTNRKLILHHLLDSKVKDTKPAPIKQSTLMHPLQPQTLVTFS